MILCLPNNKLRSFALEMRNDFLCGFEFRDVADDLNDAFEWRHRLQIDRNNNRFAISMNGIIPAINTLKNTYEVDVVDDVVEVEEEDEEAVFCCFVTPTHLCKT